MKILMICPYYFPAISFGGVIQSSLNLSHELVKRNHEVVVFSSNAESKTTRLQVPKVVHHRGVIIHYFSTISSRNIGGFFITPGIIGAARRLSHEFDIVHLQEYRTFQNIVASYASRKSRTPYIIQPHGTLPRIEPYMKRKLVFDATFGNNILKYASAGVPMSNFELEHFKKIDSWSGLLEIIPNSVDLQSFANTADGNVFRKNHGISEDASIILFLGRLNRIKNLETLVRAFSIVLEVCENAILVIAGPDDGEQARLNDIMNSLGISSKVIFTGLLHFQEKASALNACEFLVLPSFYELFGTVILEAFACGKPVIGSNVGSTPDLVMPGKTGYLFHPNDVQQLSKIAIGLLSSPSEARRMGREGRKLVKEKYTVGQVSRLLESLYESILK